MLHWAAVSPKSPPVCDSFLPSPCFCDLHTFEESYAIVPKWTNLYGLVPLKGIQFSSVQSLSRVQLFVTPWFAARQASLSITNSRSPPKPMSIESVMPSSHLILRRLLLLPPIPPTIRVFSNESTLHMRWPKYWSFSFSIIPSSEHPGLSSFRMDWLDLLAVQGTLKSLLQHHSSKASILRCSSQCSTVRIGSAKEGLWALHLLSLLPEAWESRSPPSLCDLGQVALPLWASDFPSGQ